MTRVPFSIKRSLYTPKELQYSFKRGRILSKEAYFDHTSPIPKGALQYIKSESYGVATVSRIDKIIGLFCKRAL